MTVAEVAELLDVCERTVWRWAAIGVLPEPVHLPAPKGQVRWTRWRRADIDAYLAPGARRGGLTYHR